MSEEKGSNLALFTDLDGTLLQSDRRASVRSLDTLRALGRKNVWRAVVTGRSHLSARTVLSDTFPIDFLITSSGVGVFDFRDQTLVESHSLSTGDVRRVTRFLIDGGYDFMVHAPVPENHTFEYWEQNAHNPDFVRRHRNNAEHCRPLKPGCPGNGRASQFVVVCPTVADPWRTHDALSNALKDLSVIRTTSPSDHRSTWFEIFPKHVSKARSAARLCERLGVDARRSAAVGNDYNDSDMLQWCGFPFVVRNAPEPLRARFPVVSDHNADGFSEAVQRWLDGIEHG
ncbi:MAG: HAD family hydrolase [Gemmatimonadota bacterium]|nr:HAD family hydrolase [Gemmatimonadota bacterium]